MRQADGNADAFEAEVLTNDEMLRKGHLNEYARQVHLECNITQVQTVEIAPRSIVEHLHIHCKCIKVDELLRQRRCSLILPQGQKYVLRPRENAKTYYTTQGCHYAAPVEVFRAEFVVFLTTGLGNKGFEGTVKTVSERHESDIHEQACEPKSCYY